MEIRLEMLGGLRALVDGEESATLRSLRSRLALLAFLAVERTTTRDAIKALFWPESTTANARHALRQALYHIRGVAGDGWLYQRAGELRATDALTSDVSEFRAAVTRGDSETACGLYAGPFLDAVHLADTNPWSTWVDTQRAALGRDFRRCCRAWLEGRLEEGDLAGALAVARRWVIPEPMDDEAQHRLIELLASTGARAAALEQYDAYTATLARDDLTPLDETAELADRIRRNQLPSQESGPAIGPAILMSRPGRQADGPNDRGRGGWQGQVESLVEAGVISRGDARSGSGPSSTVRWGRIAAIGGALAALTILYVAWNRPLRDASGDGGTDGSNPVDSEVAVLTTLDMVNELTAGPPPPDSAREALAIAIELTDDPSVDDSLPWFEVAASDTTFTLAQLELAMQLCCSYTFRYDHRVDPQSSPRVDTLLDRVAANLDRLQPAARHHYQAVRHLINGNRPWAAGEYLEAAALLPQRYGAVAAVLAAEVGRYDDALETTARLQHAHRDLGAKAYLAVVQALHATGRFQDQLDTIRKWQEDLPELARSLSVFERGAIGALGSLAAVDTIINELIAGGGMPINVYRYFVVIGIEMRIHGHRVASDTIMDRAIEVYENDLIDHAWPWESLLPFYLRGRFDRLAEHINRFRDAGRMSDSEAALFAGLVAARQGRVGEAREAMRRIEEEGEFSAPERLYHRARIAALAGWTGEARRLLREALGAGFRLQALHSGAFDLESIRDESVLSDHVAFR